MALRYDECMVSGSIPKFILQVVEYLGGSREEFLRYLEITPFELESIEKTIPLNKLSTFFEHADNVMHCPDIGLYAGRLAYTNILRLQLHMSTICNDFREYLNIMPSVLQLFGDVGEIVVTKEGGGIRMEWVPMFPDKLGERYFSDFFLGLASKMVDSLCVKPMPIVCAGFSYKQPSNLSLIHDFFGLTTIYAQTSCYLDFQKEVLDYPLIQVEGMAEDYPGYAVTKLFEKKLINDAFLVRLRQIIVQQLPKGRVNVDSISVVMGTSRRSLQRHLADRDICFTQVLADIRSQLSVRYLTERQLSIADVAFLLGYVDQGAFTKAFKGWHGKTPKIYRKEEVFI